MPPGRSELPGELRLRKCLEQCLVRSGCSGRLTAETSQRPHERACACEHMCVHACVRAHTHVHVSTCSAYACMCARTCCALCACVHACVCTRVCVRAHMCACVHTHACACAYSGVCGPGCHPPLTPCLPRPAAWCHLLSVVWGGMEPLRFVNGLEARV